VADQDHREHGGPERATDLLHDPRHATGVGDRLTGQPGESAKLASSGLLDADDPALAAGHLSALTFGQVNNKTMMGTVQLSDADAEADRIISSGIAAFLRAYGPAAR
jgi:hypothetical protein